MLWLIYSGLKGLDRAIRGEQTDFDEFNRSSQENPLEFQPKFSCNVMRDNVGGRDAIVNLNDDLDNLPKYTGLDCISKNGFSHTPPPRSQNERDSCFQSVTTVSSAIHHIYQRLRVSRPVVELAHRPEGPPVCEIREVNADAREENKQKLQLDEAESNEKDTGSISILARFWTWLKNAFCKKIAFRRFGKTLVKEEVIAGERCLVMPTNDGIRAGQYCPSGCYTPWHFDPNSAFNIHYRSTVSWNVEQAFHRMEQEGPIAWIPKIIKWKSSHQVTFGDSLPTKLPSDETKNFVRFYIGA